MPRKKLDIRKKYIKKAFLVSKDRLKEAIDMDDVIVYLDEESHYDNGESEFVYRMYVKDNIID